MLIKRYIFDEVVRHLPRKEISIIVGPRQAGKTTLMNLLINYLIKKGKKTIFFSLDFERDMPYFRSQMSLLDKLKLELGNHKAFVFIDEIQRKEDAGVFLKGLYDMNTPYKFVVSGSGSMELKEKIHESLVGRKKLFELNTVSLREFINYKTGYKYEDSLRDYFSIDPGAMSLLMEYINFGGYPRVILEDTLSEKISVMDDIYRSYIERDISYLLRIERVDAFSHLIRILAGQIGNMVNLTELSSTIGIALPTIKNYLYYAEKTFVIKRITPFYRNIRKEISKSPVVYFYDIGLRNYSLGLFGRISHLSEAGFLFQNLVFNLLSERFSKEARGIHYWRTKDKAEVDFIIDLGDRVIPVEVKAKMLRSPVITRPIKSFIKRYNPEEAWIINLGFTEETRFQKTRVRFMPIWDMF
jgi:hypothetical protein